MQVWQESPARSGFVLQVCARFPLCFLLPATAPPASLVGLLTQPDGFSLGVFSSTVPAGFHSADPAKSLCLGNAGAAPVSPQPASSAASS